MRHHYDCCNQPSPISLIRHFCARGRFDRQIVVDRLISKVVRKFLKVHVKGKPISPEVELGVIARRTPGFTGADLSNLVNEAALMAARKNKNKIDMPEWKKRRSVLLWVPSAAAA